MLYSLYKNWGEVSKKNYRDFRMVSQVQSYGDNDYSIFFLRLQLRVQINLLWKDIWRWLSDTKRLESGGVQAVARIKMSDIFEKVIFWLVR